MNTFASDIVKKKLPGTVHSQDWTAEKSSGVPEPFGQGPVPILRKASCSCGGGCASCRASSNESHVTEPGGPAEMETSRQRNEWKPLPLGVGASSQSPGHVLKALDSGGQALDSQTRNFFEPRLGYDLSGVRVHTGSNAEHSAAEVSANAYTLGQNIVFGAARFEPDTHQGRLLLGHELTHVVQQSKAQINAHAFEPENSPAEREASTVANDIVYGGSQNTVTAIPKGIPRDVGFAARGPIPDAYGLGYNEILTRGGQGSMAAVFDLASLETASMDADLGKFDAMTPEKKSAILALEPYAVGSACARWFNRLRAHANVTTALSPMPKLTPEQEREGELAYYQSTRAAQLDSAYTLFLAELPQLTPTQIYDRWKSDRSRLIKIASTPNHGLPPEQMILIYRLYWGDFRERAVAKQIDLNNRRLGATDDFDHAEREEEFANAALAAVVDAHENLLAAQAIGRSLTLDVLTEYALNSVGFRQGLALLAMAIGSVGQFRGSSAPRLPKPTATPTPAQPVAGSLRPQAPPTLEVFQGGGQGRAAPSVNTTPAVNQPVAYTGRGGAAPNLAIDPVVAPVAAPRHLQSVPMPAPVPAQAPVIMPAPSPLAPPIAASTAISPFAAIGMGVASRIGTSQLPRPDVDTDLDEPVKRGQCTYQSIPQQFGRFPCHAAYATSLSGVSREVRVKNPIEQSVDFDAMNHGGMLFEVKTGYRWLPFMRDEKRKNEIITRFWLQAVNQLMVAGSCGHPLKWYFNDPYAASFFGAVNSPFPKYFGAPLPVEVWYVPYACDQDSDG